MSAPTPLPHRRLHPQSVSRGLVRTATHDEASHGCGRDFQSHWLSLCSPRDCSQELMEGEDQ